MFLSVSGSGLGFSRLPETPVPERQPGQAADGWKTPGRPALFRPRHSPTAPSAPLGKQLHRGSWGSLMSKPGSPTGVLTFHNAVGSYGGWRDGPWSTGHEKGRDVPTFSFLCKPRPAGIRTLGFEARGKTGARDPGVDIEDPLTSTMK